MFADFHTHVLPDIDDGARDFETSHLMLSMLKERGVGVVAATPHFYAHRQPISEFLQKRQRSLDTLLNGRTDNMPDIVPAAEVYVEREIRHIDLRPLCYRNTDCLLVELPYMSYQAWFLEEVYNLCLRQSLTPVFAHLERYTALYPEDAIREILDFDNAIIQINLESLLNVKTREFVQSLVKQGYRIVFGSDCHDSKNRLSNIVKARSVLRSRLGEEWLINHDKFSLDLLNR